MVIIRISEDINNQCPENMSNRNIKILSKLKNCKLVTNNNDQKIENKIEFMTYTKMNKQKDLDNTNEIHNIINNEYKKLTMSDTNINYNNNTIKKDYG